MTRSVSCFAPERIRRMQRRAADAVKAAPIPCQTKPNRMAECCLQPQSAARRCSGEAARSDANFRVSARRARLCGLMNSCPSAKNHTFQPLWQIRDKRTDDWHLRMPHRQSRQSAFCTPLRCLPASSTQRLRRKAGSCCPCRQDMNFPVGHAVARQPVAIRRVGWRITS